MRDRIKKLEYQVYDRKDDIYQKIGKQMDDTKRILTRALERLDKEADKTRHQAVGRFDNL